MFTMDRFEYLFANAAILRIHPAQYYYVRMASVRASVNARSYIYRPFAK